MHFRTIVDSGKLLNSLYSIGFSAHFNPYYSDSFHAVFSWKPVHFVEN